MLAIVLHLALRVRDQCCECGFDSKTLQTFVLRKCLQPEDSASIAFAKRSVLSLFINLRCAEIVYLSVM